MKKLFLLLLIVACSITVTDAQNRKVKAMLAEIDGQWETDDKGQLTYVEVFELPGLSKDEIFSRAENYFVYNYGSGKSVLQTKDKDLGRMIGKGVFSNVHVGMSLSTTTFDAWHILRIDVKEGKARVILTATNYDIVTTYSSIPDDYSNGLPISGFFPMNPKNSQKTMYGRAFYKLHKRCKETLVALGDALRNGNIEAVADEW